MTEREMYLLEKAAHEDPFLSEALDGLATRRDALAEDIADLKRRLADRKKSGSEKRRLFLVMPRWLQAAAILVLVVTGSLVFYHHLFHSDTKLADTPGTSRSVRDTAKKAAAAQQEAQTEAPAVEDAPALTPTKAESRQMPKEIAKTSIHQDGDRVKTFKQAEEKIENETLTRADEDKLRIQSKSAPKALAKKEADVLQKTITDSTALATIQNDVHRATDSPDRLKPVTVYGYQKQAQVSAPVQEADANAQPETGWEAFQNYLLENSRLKKPETVAELESIISFTVNRKGKRKSFAVEQSAGVKFDEEAIRLIRNGPQWTLKPGIKKTRVTVAVRFR